MTQEDYATLARWQSSNEGNAAAAVYTLSTALGDIEDIARSRDGAALVRNEYMQDLLGIADRLACLLYKIEPQKHMQAAE